MSDAGTGSAVLLRGVSRDVVGLDGTLQTRLPSRKKFQPLFFGHSSTYKRLETLGELAPRTQRIAAGVKALSPHGRVPTPSQRVRLGPQALGGLEPALASDPGAKSSSFLQRPLR